jgi:homoaconitase/3-isopropylmalate dehydratase large subunit/3-isopropylmalate dehydratase small subunit
MKTGRTFVEKLLNASAGSIVCREPDLVLSHDNSARIKKLFERMGGKVVKYPEKLMVVLDRKMTGTTEELIRDYNSIHHFMEEQQAGRFFDCDKGICHQLLAEQVKEGMLIAGNDSHTCTAGAFNCLAVGLNKTETAVLWKTGKMWFRVPETVKIVLRNSLPEGVYAKDLALWIIGMLQNEHVGYTCLEYHGEGVRTLSIADRMTIANVSAEIGVKSAVFPPDDALADYFGDYAVQGVWADANAAYKREFEIDLSGVMPLAMSVGLHTEVKSVREWGALSVQQGLIGACGTGRIEDMRVVAHILKDKKLAPGFQLSVVPASREIYMQAIEEGLVDMIFKSGAAVLGASCGACLGSSSMVLADTRRYLTSTNSNSQQRMFSFGVEKYVASPATIAMTALTGVLTSPAEEREAVYPYWSVPAEPVSVHDFDNRLFGNVWNYKEIDHITTEQLFAEQWTYRISSEDKKGMLPHLLAGLDVTFASRVETGQILIVGEDFGCGKLIEHAASGLVAAGIVAVIARSVNRRFFRMALNRGLPILIAPEIVDKYHSGDILMFNWADRRIYLNQEEYNLPDVAPEFEEALTHLLLP